jgi:hypothetical protein
VTGPAAFQSYTACWHDTVRLRKATERVLARTYGAVEVAERMRAYDADTITNLVNFEDRLKELIGPDAFRAKWDFFAPRCPDHPLLRPRRAAA